MHAQKWGGGGGVQPLLFREDNPHALTIPLINLMRENCASTRVQGNPLPFNPEKNTNFTQMMHLFGNRQLFFGHVIWFGSASLSTTPCAANRVEGWGNRRHTKLFPGIQRIKAGSENVSTIRNVQKKTKRTRKSRGLLFPTSCERQKCVFCSGGTNGTHRSHWRKQIKVVHQPSKMCSRDL